MQPIHLYSLATPNGQKIGIALEEMQIPYEAHLIDISKGDQFTPEYVKMNPNSKIPVIVDPVGPDGKPITMMESGAILLYLAAKSGRCITKDLVSYQETVQWLFFQAAHIGPFFGQFGHFFHYAREKCDHPYPIERYKKETQRLLAVLESRLKGRTFMVNEEFSIADIAIVPWVKCLDIAYYARAELQLDQFPLVNAWVDRVWQRPAVQRGILVCKKPDES